MCTCSLVFVLFCFCLLRNFYHYLPPPKTKQNKNRGTAKLLAEWPHNFGFHQQHLRDTVSLHPHHHQVLSLSLILVTMTGVECTVSLNILLMITLSDHQLCSCLISCEFCPGPGQDLRPDTNHMSLQQIKMFVQVATRAPGSPLLGPSHLSEMRGCYAPSPGAQG